MPINEKVKLLYSLIAAGTPFSTDSRRVTPGGLFFALKGDSFNGNDYAEKALQAGCSLAVIDRDNCLADDRYILVDDVLSTLQQLSQMHRDAFSIPVIGITGTNGKTTTKELCHAVLSSALHAQSTRGNLNNHIGVPLTLLSLRPPVGIAIVEMGANHTGEIEFLCKLSKPGYGLITNIGKAHLEGFGSVENIIRAKSELYQYIGQNNGTLFVNGEDEILLRQSATYTKILYGKNTSNHCSGEIISTGPFIGIRYQVNKMFGKAQPGVTDYIQTKLVGSYNFGNIMAAVTIGHYFGVAASKIRQAIEDYQPQNNRSQLMKTELNTVLLDAYNANPTSMEVSLLNFLPFRGEGPTAVILGDMLELGAASESEHHHIFRLATESGFDLAVLVGPEFCKVAKETENIKVFKNTEAASYWLQNHPIKNHHILLKGSRGIKMEDLVKHF